MSLRPRLFVSTLLLMLTSALSTMAHHSVGGEFDTSKTISFRAQLTRVEWVNPHIYFHFDAKDASGAVKKWDLESVPVAFVRRAGIALKDFKVGQDYDIEAWPARDGSKGLGLVTKLTEPAGRFFVLAPGSNGQ